MDATPHLHNVQLRSESAFYPWDHPWSLVYGDTTVKIGSRLGFGRAARYPTRKEFEAALTKAVKKHDAGSIEAGRKKAEEESAIRALTAFNEYASGGHYEYEGLQHKWVKNPVGQNVWGSDILEKVVNEGASK